MHRFHRHLLAAAAVGALVLPALPAGAQDNVLKADDFSFDSSGAMTALPLELGDGLGTLADMERAYVQHVLAQTGGHKSKTAEILKVSRGRLDRIIEKHGLTAEFG